jgi:hypothetical protein
MKKGVSTAGVHGDCAGQDDIMGSCRKKPFRSDPLMIYTVKLEGKESNGNSFHTVRPLSLSPLGITEEFDLKFLQTMIHLNNLIHRPWYMLLIFLQTTHYDTLKESNTLSLLHASHIPANTL